MCEMVDGPLHEAWPGAAKHIVSSQPDEAWTGAQWQAAIR